MPEHEKKQTCSIGMLAHVDAGKTTLSEAVLYQSGAINKFGRVDNGNCFLDTEKLEKERGITIFSKQAVFVSGNRTYTLIDTPGHTDFSTEMERSLQILDAAVLIISAKDNIQGHTETLWRLLSRYHIPVFLFVNKMDQDGANRNEILQKLKNSLSDMITDFSYPDGEEISLCSEELLNYYLETGELSDSLISKAFMNRKIFPCFFGSALNLIGTDELITAFNTYLSPADYPNEFGAKVFKIKRDREGRRLTFMKITGGSLRVKQILENGEKINQIRIYSGNRFSQCSEVTAGCICAVTGLENTEAGMSLGCDTPSLIPFLEPVMTYRLILPESVKPVEVLSSLKHLEEEDPQLHIVWNEILSEITIQVMGAVQIDILKSLIHDRLNISVEFGTGNIVYKETITNKVEGVGHFEPLRHYAEVHLIMEPGEPGSGISISSEISEDLLSLNWQRLILTHLREKTFKGVLCGAPLTDVKITAVAGKAHPKHTEGGDFRQAVYRAVRQGLMQAKSHLLEPYYNFSLRLPTEFVGRAMADLDRMFGKFEMETNDSITVLTGTVPVSTSNSYQLEVNAYSHGHGTFTLSPGGYGPCHNEDEVIAEKAYDPDRDTHNPSSSVFCTHGSGFIVEWHDVFNHMHIDSCLDNKSGSSDIVQPVVCMQNPNDISLGTDEIDAIIRETFYSNSNSRGNKWNHKKKPENDFSGRTIKAPSPKKEKIPYLLVDGYNIIFAWNELNELSKENLEASRSKLMDILCAYQSIVHTNVIVVFDAYRIKGHETEYFSYNNINVVYTKESETADQYIEKFAHENNLTYDIRVATSDGLEQIIIRGQGCRLVSAREFENEVNHVTEQFRELHKDILS